MKLNLEIVRIEMARQNMNQKKLAEKAGVESSTISLIMKRKSIGRPDTWQKIANAIGKCITEIIEE